MPRPDQTEKATPKRVSEARGRGQVAKSADLGSAAVFLAAVFVLHGTLMKSIDGLGGALQGSLEHIVTRHDFTILSAWGLFARSGEAMLPVLATLFIVTVAFGIVVNLLQFGFLLTLQAIAPKFSKLNPVTGLTRLFSKQVLVNLLKQILKLGAVFVIIYMSLRGNIPMLYTLAHGSPHQILAFIDQLVFGIGWRFGVFLLIVGIADYVYERRELDNSLKMSKQEVKDEQRQQEGNAEAKQAFKRRQRELSRRRMMAAVPKATVVVTNPTHFAIALQWDEIQMDAPLVTAKGADLMAKRIREVAREHGVPILENPPLARTLYEKVELDSAVPPNMYAAVAQVIAFVFKLKRGAS